MTRVGLLALQGDVPEHERAITDVLGEGSVLRVRSPVDLDRIDALVLPGGESTTIERLLRENGLDVPLVARARAGLPVLATCAGLILVARELEPSPGGRDPRPLGLLDVLVRRNDYGRQRESFEAPVEVEGVPGGPFPGVFIRAPRILSVGRSARPIATWNGEVVGVRQGALWGLCFHPELTGDGRLLRAFLGRPGTPPASRRRE